MPVSENKARILVRVHPNAATNEVTGFTERVLQVRIAAPPVKGKANDELIAFLSQKLAVGKSKLRILSGHHNRNKVLTIEGLSQQEIMGRLSPAQNTKPASSSGARE